LTRRLTPTLAALVLLGASACRLSTDAARADGGSFAGETLRIIVGFSTGGPYDLHARLLAGALQRALPGRPSIVVENMPGAGGVLAARYLASVARPDGLTVGVLAESSIVEIADSAVLSGLALLGSPGASAQLVAVTARSGIVTVDDWRRAKRPLRFAGTGPRTPPVVFPRIAGAALGLPVEMLSGFGGSPEMRLALESGEADAIFVSVDAFNTAFRDANVRVILRFSADPVPGFDVPDAMSIAPDARARDLLATGIYAMAPMIRFYAAPRGVPADRLAQLRQGLRDAWADPQFLTGAAAAGFAIAPVSAETMERGLDDVVKRRDIIADLRAILAAR
jgi:tripartite-type tricarboxylate transporter receptor subunit TctC